MDETVHLAGASEAILNTTHRGSVGVITDTFVSVFGTWVGKDLHIHAETFCVCKGDPLQARTFSQINSIFEIFSQVMRTFGGPFSNGSLMMLALSLVEIAFCFLCNY